jgi:threonine aldolase
MIDLRSDTVTKPTPGMLAAMMAAVVGDDVYAEDPTVNELEARVADRFGKEAALFVPTGTMGNQIAVRVHCHPQDEVLLEASSHIYLWEAGAPAALSGVTLRTIPGRYGVLDVADLEPHLHPDDMHSVRSRLVALENTHNRGGGVVYPLDKTAAVSAWARANGLAMHLDGARIWNAEVASGVGPREWARHFDTLSVCFSKGLGAPAGSALVGPKDLIAHGRRVRKLFGGAMRQIGFLAAACLYAMDRNVARLADDHANARLLADAVRDVPGLSLVPPQVETNLVWAEVSPALGTAKAVAARLKETGILAAALGTTVIRLVTHLDVSRADCERAAAAIRGLARA